MAANACSQTIVLVVEDEPLQRWNTVAVLQEARFEVVEAANAIEAISILEKRFDIGVVVTDVQMPGSMDGLRLAHLISIRWPPIKIIATSGRLRLRVEDLPQGGRFLSKPYSTSDSTSELTGMLHDLVRA